MQINLNVAVQIPEGYIIVEKFELEELQKYPLEGIYWSMQYLQNHVIRKQVLDQVSSPLSLFRSALNIGQRFLLLNNPLSKKKERIPPSGIRSSFIILTPTRRQLHNAMSAERG